MRGRVCTTDKSSATTCRERCVQSLLLSIFPLNVGMEAQIHIESKDCWFILVFYTILLKIKTRYLKS